MSKQQDELNPYMFRAYDIRGTVGEDITEATAERLGKAYGTYLPFRTVRPALQGQSNRRSRTGLPKPSVAVGRDNRTSSPCLQQSFIMGAKSTGCEIFDLGLALSPMLYFAVCYWGLDGGVNVTGSHNPVTYNGFKLTLADAVPIAEEQIQEIRRIANAKAFPSGQGSVTARSITEDYVRELASRVKIARRMKVVVDTRNGTASLFSPRIIREAGCEVIGLHTESDGTFPNGVPDPEVEANVEDLRKAVIAEKADLGIAFDGDGDRMGVVDEKGERHEADEVLMILARDFLTRHPGERVMMDVKSSRLLVQDIENHGGRPVMFKTGHSLIKNEMREKGILLAGEVSGHIFFKENYYGFDDATLGALRLLEAVSKRDIPVSAHWADLPRVYKTSELKAECPDDQKFQIVSEVAAYFKSRYPKSLDIDGIRVELPEGWGLVRPSNTNPYLTLRFEAESQEAFEKIRQEIYSRLSQYKAVRLP